MKKYHCLILHDSVIFTDLHVCQQFCPEAILSVQLVEEGLQSGHPAPVIGRHAGGTHSQRRQGNGLSKITHKDPQQLQNASMKTGQKPCLHIVRVGLNVGGHRF